MDGRACLLRDRGVIEVAGAERDGFSPKAHHQ